MDWKSSPDRKPLLLRGARQVGKTYLLKEFGRMSFSNFHYVNFETENKFSEIFAASLNPKQIIKDLAIKLEKDINIKTDLLIFDEIQACPRAITSLKYFCEELPDLAVCCAGSLIGVLLSPEPFPVGKVTFLNLFPMTFEEFLWASDAKTSPALFDEFVQTKTISATAEEHLNAKLREYSFIGGMPQAVCAHCQEPGDRAVNKTMLIREIQKTLLKSYYADFAKHSGKINAMHIVSVFENVPLQLARELDGSVTRYKFQDVVPGKKGFADLAGPIDWLVNAGLIHKVKICNHPEIPLSAFCKPNAFKLYYFDIGLLGCALNLPMESFFGQEFGMAKGFLAENLVCQELIANTDAPLHAWTEQNSEIEFLLQIKDQVVPVEVKAGNRTRAKSLQVYLQKYKPKLATMLSHRPPRIDSHRVLQHIPLCLAGVLENICDQLLFRP